MKERIIRIMQEEELNLSQFAEAIGVQTTTMQHIRSERNNPSLDVVTRILKCFSWINPDWLLFGEGNMRRDGTSAGNSQSQPSLFASDSSQSAAPTTQNVVRQPLLPRKKTSVKASEDIRKALTDVIEDNIQLSKPERTIDRMLVFYSDSTYETFVNEKRQ